MAQYTLSAKITADAKEFIRAFKEAKGETTGLEKIADKIGGGFNKFGDKVSKIGDSLTKNVTKPALIAGTAVGGIVLTKGFQRLAGIDTARAKLSGLGHDAESVENIMTSALDSVKGTAFGLDVAATTAANAVAAGVKPGQDLTRYLTLAGDAAAIAGADMSEMGSIFNKVQTANKAYNGELQQLSDRGLPIYQWLAKEAGTTADAIFDMASQGEISSEMLLKAVENNIGGAAKKMGEESFVAGISNIWAAVGRLGAQFLDAGGKGGGFFSTIKEHIPSVIDSIDNLAPKVEQWGVTFGEATGKVISKIKEIKQWYDDLSPAMQDLTKKAVLWGAVGAVALGPFLKVVGLVSRVMGFVFPIAGKVIGVISSVTAAFGAGGLQGVLVKVAARFPMLASAITLLSGPIGWIVLGITALVTGLIIAYNKSETFREKVIYAFETVRDYVMIAIEAIRDFLMDVWGGVVEWWAENNELILEAAQNVWNVISTVVTTAMEVISSIISFVWPIIKIIIVDTWEAIKNVIQGAVNIILNIITLFANLFTGNWSGVWESVKGILSGAVQLIWGLINLWFVGKILKVGKTFFNLFKGVFSKGWNFIRNLFSNTLGAITSNVTSRFNAIKHVATTIFDAVKNAMTKPIVAARDLIKGAIDKIVGFFKGLGSKLKIKIPKPKLPSFSISGGFSLMPPKVPKIGIKWNAEGGLMKRPTIFGAMGSTLMGGGEAGPEAILPLTPSVLAGIGKGIANESNGGMVGNTTTVKNDIVIHYTSTGDTEQDVDDLADEIDKEFARREGFGYFLRGGKR